MVSIQVLATPMMGLARSSSVNPMPLSMARAGARSRPWVMVWLWSFMKQPVYTVARGWYSSTMDDRRFSDVGGTPGGLGHFLLGFAMTCLGGYLITNQVTVIGSYWNFYGPGTFGVTLIPLLFGVGLLFWNGRSVTGWVLTAAGALF